jgi:hypothetical protein
MKPGPSVVRSLVNSWRLKMKFNDQEWQRLSKCLIALSEANGGRVFFDTKLKQREFDDHFRESCEAVIQRAMRLRARELACEPVIPYRMVESDGAAPPLPSLKRRRSAPRIDIHKATRELLIQAAEVSNDEANAILAARKAAGRLTDLTVLEELLDKESWKKFKEQFCIYPDDSSWRCLSKMQRKFVRDPTFGNYLWVDGVFSQDIDERDRKEALFQLLDEILRQTMPTAGFDPRRITAASEIVRGAKVRRKASGLKKGAITDLTGIVLLDGSQYLKFLKTVLVSSTKRIRVIMFFMTYKLAPPTAPGKPPKVHALAPVMAELCAAKERQVDVRVILDKDAPTDVFNSRRINQEAYQFFVDHGIPVVFSSANKVIHSKIVVVDGRHVLLGSHNWTLGSMYNYDEKSVYLESQQLAEAIEKQFDELWHKPEAEDAVRDQLLTTIEQGAEVLRSAHIYSVDDFLQRASSAELREELAERSQLPLQTISTLHRELTLRDLEARMKRTDHRVSRGVRMLQERIGPIPGQARVLCVIPGDGLNSRTIFSLTNEQGERHNLPLRLRPGTKANLKAKVVNETGRTENYRLRIEIGNETRPGPAFSLASGEQTEHLITFAAPADGYKRLVRLTLESAEAKPSPANSLFVIVTGDAKVSRKVPR